MPTLLRVSVLAALLFAPCRADASVYWNAGVHSAGAIGVSVCFVGDAVTSQPTRVAEILRDIREFTYAANVRFTNGGRCPDSVPNMDGTDRFDGDIRVVIPNTSVSGTGPVPGVGCRGFRDALGNYTGGNEGWGSWSNGPSDLNPNRSCQFNLKLGNDALNGDPYLNHTLHEFGHALGLAHEHQRADVNANCTEPNYGGGVTSYLTPYDRASVMHYQFVSCHIDGNYGTSGLSYYDRLAVHVLYPEDQRVAEYAGHTVIHGSESLVLRAGWLVAGVNLALVTRNMQWRIDGTLISSTATVSRQLPRGRYRITFTHDDFLGRSYSSQTIVRVLDDDEFRRTIVAPIAAALLQ